MIIIEEEQKEEEEESFSVSDLFCLKSQWILS